MSLVQRWAVTSELSSNELSGSELAQIAAACDVQLTRDVAREWPEVNVGTVQSFPDPHAVPHGYSIAVAVDVAAMPDGALGFHYGSRRRPMARIGFDRRDPAGVATTFSHELVEAAVDPSGNRTVICTVPGVGRQDVLVEACDPCEAFTYLVDGLPVSDFVLRAYYGPHRWHVMPKGSSQPEGAGAPVTRPFSYTGQLDAPLVVAEGGYLSFCDPVSDEWAQLTWFDGPEPAVRVLGQHDDDRVSFREWIDMRTASDALKHVGSL